MNTKSDQMLQPPQKTSGCKMASSVIHTNVIPVTEPTRGWRKLGRGNTKITSIWFWSLFHVVSKQSYTT